MRSSEFRHPMTPLQLTSGREGIVRPRLDQPWLPKQNAGHDASPEKRSKDDHLKAEEEEGDEDECGCQCSNHDQRPVLGVNTANPLADTG